MNEFIFMLTRGDVTVSDALDVYEEVRASALRWIGFKDIGVSPTCLGDLAKRIHADGRKVSPEIVSLDEDSEKRSVETGLGEWRSKTDDIIQ